MITAREGLDEISIEVVLTPRRGGIFSSKRQAERDVEAAELEAAVKRESLKLRISPVDDDDRRFEERWIIEMPSRLKIKLEHGVGDVAIEGAAGGIELDSGVGDVEVEAPEGDITIDLGVGVNIGSTKSQCLATIGKAQLHTLTGGLAIHILVGITNGIEIDLLICNDQKHVGKD